MRIIQDRLARAGSTMKASAVVVGMLAWLVTCLGVWLALFLLDNLLRLPAGLRFPLAIGGGLVIVVGLVRWVGFPALARRSAERAALALEDRYSIGGNVLISACQFEAQALTTSERVFARHTATDSDRALGGIPPSSLWQSRRVARIGAWTLAMALAWAVYGLAVPRHAGNALARYLLPLGDVPPVGSVLIHTVPETDTEIREGEDLQVRVFLRRPGETTRAARDAPVLVRVDGATRVAPTDLSAGPRTAGDRVPDQVTMLPDSVRPDAYTYTFRRVRSSFAFRVFAEDTYSRSLHVRVRPMPAIVASLFRLTPPSYTELAQTESPGPPASLSALPGSRLEVSVELDRPAAGLRWHAPDVTNDFTGGDKHWTVLCEVRSAGAYRVEVLDPAIRRDVTIAAGEIGLETDAAPQIDFLTDNRNRYVNPGSDVALELQASDNYGIREINVTTRLAREGSVPVPIKAWSYLGPPGRRGPLKETVRLVADPAVFEPGETYLVEAACHDFCPGSDPGKSRPVVLRIKAWDDLALPGEDALSRAFEFLRRTIATHGEALALTGNLEVHLGDTTDNGALPGHCKAMHDRQGAARQTGRDAVKAFESSPEGDQYGGILAPLIEHEMGWVLADIASLNDAEQDKLSFRVQEIGRRQEYILRQLISLLGRLSGDRSEAGLRDTALSDEATAPPITAEDAGRQLHDDLEAFSRAQKRIVDLSRTLLDNGPEDMTEEEEKILGELARQEAEWARLFEEKLTDFSKLPLQDFADGSLAEEFNEVHQEVKRAAESLYAKNIELAVPQEQSGLEKAEELVHNLERWLPDGRDNLKWLMEEPPAPFDIPLAELPGELEDIVGELLDEEQAMTEEVEDVTSSWMDSPDKGAGWDAMDGPISSMSAKGVTGNLLPNQQEIGGRAGEGRSGRSHGQMVEESAVGKDGRDTPTRLTPSPFESGSVKDSSTKETGGSTGGGKLSGFGEEGLRGPAPRVRLDDMARLGERQSKIRQTAEALSLKLRRYNLATGDLEVSIKSMHALEQAAEQGDGLGIRRSFSRVLDALAEAERVVSSEAGLHRERSGLAPWVRDEVMAGMRDGSPRGYEEMIAEYFRVLAGQETPQPGEQP